jgi:hypothetical protein
LLEKSVEVTTTAYVLGNGAGMALERVMISKSESDDGMESEEDRGFPQSVFNSSSQIQTFFSHVKQRPFVSNLQTQSY